MYVLEDIRSRMAENLPTENWWTPQQAQLVEDRQRRWHRADFAPSNMVLFHRGNGQGSVGRRLSPGEIPSSDAEVVNGAWDHEHCALCWKEISAAGNPGPDTHGGCTLFAGPACCGPRSIGFPGPPHLLSTRA